MKYRAFIEDTFLIDEPQLGQLVPFKFNKVQEMYYEELVKLGIEEKGVSLALREFIVKARREGFSSLILAIFAADDILQDNPTESMVVSYKDDATGTFRKRYRRYVLSWYARRAGATIESIQADPNVLESYSKQCFSVDSNDLELKHNRAHFYCGTASARTGGRGGVLQKLLFSEAAHYPDTDKITAREVIDGTSAQVDKQSGWIFQESTGNGKGNYFYQTYEQIKKGLSRYLLRFYGWRSFYTQEQFDQYIKPEHTDADMLKQEYPETEEEAFMASNLSFISADKLLAMVEVKAEKSLELQLEFSGVNYIDQCDSIKDFVITFVKTHPNRKIYLGLDTAKSIDCTVMTLLMEKELAVRGGVQGIAIDSTGQDFVADWFEKNTDWYIHRVNFSRPSKSIMYKNLQVVIEDKLTTLPEMLMPQTGPGPIEFVSDEWSHFYNQMLNLQKEIMGRMLIVHHPKGQCTPTDHDYNSCVYHDDHPDSWALVEILYVTINGVAKSSRPPEENSSFDNSVRRLLDNKKNKFGEGGEDYV